MRTWKDLSWKIAFWLITLARDPSSLKWSKKFVRLQKIITAKPFCKHFCLTILMFWRLSFIQLYYNIILCISETVTMDESSSAMCEVNEILRGYFDERQLVVFQSAILFAFMSPYLRGNNEHYFFLSFFDILPLKSICQSIENILNQVQGDKLSKIYIYICKCIKWQHNLSYFEVWPNVFGIETTRKM